MTQVISTAYDDVLTILSKDQRFISEADWKRIRTLQDKARNNQINMTLLRDDFADAILMLMRENRMWRTAVEKVAEESFSEGYDTALGEHIWDFS